MKEKRQKVMNNSRCSLLSFCSNLRVTQFTQEKSNQASYLA